MRCLYRSKRTPRKQQAAGCTQPPISYVALEVAAQTNTKAQSYFFFLAFFFLAFFAMVELLC
jgi:hypothetical protein